jgi:superfamily II DNA or RNA helicase
MADKHADEDKADVIVASIATLGRAGSKRLERFDVADFGTIVIDEAHHSSASSYQNVLAHFGLLKVENIPNDDDFVDSEANTDWNNEILLLGVTATPNRQDNNGIDKIYDEVVFNYGIIEGIQDGFLSRIRAYRINTKTSLENVHTRAGDFAQDELADAINNPERNELIVKTYQEQFSGKQALVFAIDVQHAIDLTKHFAKAKVSVAL